MHKIIRTSEEKILDVSKLEKEIEQLKKLRLDIDQKIADKEEKVNNMKDYKRMLPQIQREIQFKKDCGLEEPVTEDDKLDYMITRSELTEVFAKHFVDAIYANEVPFQGLASLFGINIPKDSWSQRFVTGLAGIYMETGLGGLETEYGPNIVDWPSSIVMTGAWETVIKFDNFRDNRKKAVKEISTCLQQGILPRKFQEWVGRKSEYSKEISRRGIASVKWKFLVEFLKYGSCSIDKGMCDVCGQTIVEKKLFRCKFCKLGRFCSKECNEHFAPINKPLCSFVNAKAHCLDIKWNEGLGCWVENILTKKEKQTILESPKSKLEKAIDFKHEGNNFFKTKSYEAAMESYIGGLDIVETLKKCVIEEKELKDELLKVNTSFWMNMAQCQLKLKNWEAAVNYCNDVLDIEVSNSKALIVRAKALSAMKKTQKAITSFEEAMKMDPSVSFSCKKEIERLKKS